MIPKPYIVIGNSFEHVFEQYEKLAEQIISDALKAGSFLKVGSVQVISPTPFSMPTDKGRAISNNERLMFTIIEDEMAVMKLQLEQSLQKADQMVDNLNSDIKCPNQTGHEWGTGGQCIHCGYKM